MSLPILPLIRLKSTASSAPRRSLVAAHQQEIDAIPLSLLRSVTGAQRFMANWIKWVKGLSRRPEVVTISSRLKRDRCVTTVALMELWEWADGETADGFISGINGDFIDDLVRIDGFFAAMQSVGWITQVDDGIQFVNWDRHNGTSAKSRAMASDRQRRKRDGVTEMSRSERDNGVTRLDKRREENNTSSSICKTKSSSAAAAAVSDELRKWAETQSKRPEWLPEGKPWVDEGTWIQLARKAPNLSAGIFEKILREARNRRLTLDNPAGYVISQILTHTKQEQV